MTNAPPIPSPLPAMDLSSNGWIACVAMASRQQVEQARERPRVRRTATSSDPYCLYCRTAEPSASEEHILSVALGNHFWVLPPGVVCETCNNQVLPS